MKKLTILRCAIFIILLLCIYYFSPDIFKQFKDIENITTGNFLILSVLCISIQLLLGMEIKILCGVFGIHLSFFEAFGLSAVRSIVNYLPMGAGAASNAIYLKKQKKLSITQYTSLLATSLILMLMTASFMGFLTSLYLIIEIRPIRMELLLLFLIIFLGSLALIFVKIPAIEARNFVTKNIKTFQNGYSLLQADSQAIKKLICLKVALLFVSTMHLKMIFVSISYQIDFSVVILMVMSISSLTIITILPGNIGLTESLSGIVANLSGNSFADGFIGIATSRIVQVIWIFLLGVPFLFYFAYKLGKKS
jgi:uncharacterized membrane protein YbhN (UPF0104 family)